MNARNRTVWSVLVAAVLLGFGCGGFADEQTLMTRARDHIEQGDYRSAVIDLKNVLKGNPRNAEARLLLGTAAYETGDTASAEKELRRAAEYGMPMSAYGELFGRSLIAQGMYADAIRQLDPDTIEDTTLKATLYALRGQAYLMLEEIDDARPEFDRALELDAQSLDAQLGIAGIHVARGDMDMAEQAMQRTLDGNPDSVRAVIAAGRFYQQKGDHDTAVSLFSRAAAAAEAQNYAKRERFNIATGLAEAQLAAGDTDAARKTIDGMLEMSPDSPTSKFLKARAAFDAGEFAEARDFLKQVLSVSADFGPALTLMGASLLALDDLDDADKYLQNAIGIQPNNLAARKLLAEVRMRQNRPDAALSALEPAASMSEDVQVMTMLAKASLRSGDQDAGLAYYLKGIEADPDNPQMQLGLASAYVATGQFGEALEVLENLPDDVENTHRSKLIRVLALMRGGAITSAEREVEAVLAEAGDDAEITNLAAGFYLSQHDDARAAELLEKSLSLAPDNVPALVNLGRINFRAGKLDEAYARYDRFLDNNPGTLQAYIAYAQLLEAGGRTEAALGQMREAMQTNPDAAEPRILLSRYHLAADEREKARTLAREAVRLGPNVAGAHVALGMVQLADRSLQEALDSFRKATELAPRLASAHFNLARAQIALRRQTEARKSLNRVLALSPDHIRATVALTRLEIADGKLARAAELADDFVARHPGLGSPLILRGDVHMAAGEFRDAVRSYDAAMAMAPSQSLVGKQYQARLRSGLDEPEKPLREWLEANPDDVSVRMLLAQHHQRRGANAEAIAAYEAVLSRQPRNAIALNNLAWLYLDTGDAGSIDKALEAAELAHEVLPDAGAITDTLGWLQLEHGDMERGLSLLRRAASQLPNNLDIQYHLAVALTRAGEASEARSILHDITNRGGDFESRADAEALLKSL